LEPEVFEEGCAVKSLVEGQLKGEAELVFQGPNRKVPWIAWGPYLWVSKPPRDRFAADGTHPTQKGGQFIADLWYEFLSSDGTTRPWFLAKPQASDLTARMMGHECERSHAHSRSPQQSHVQVELGTT
jgi:hypothetical protein